MESSVFDLLDDLDSVTHRAPQPSRRVTAALRRVAQPPEVQPHRISYSREQEEYAYDDHHGYDRTQAQDRTVDNEAQPNACDHEQLQQSYYDRQRQAAEGRARLTLPPSTSRLPMRDAFATPARPRMDLSQSAYNASQLPPTSSSPKGLSSSPAYKAGQRKQEQVPQPPQDHLNNADRRVEDFSSDEPPQPLHPAYMPPRQEAASAPALSQHLSLAHAPICLFQGTELVPTSVLPDRFRPLFHFSVFNAVQSKSFNAVYRSNDNFVLSSPTGSGKTVIFELAICRLINGFSTGQFKIVYQAPTKSLCAERQRDWQRKFGPLDLQCAELTGDTSMSELKSVQNASIIITTPEKWDSVTRKWKDHIKLMQMVKLFLIDEIHILKDDRGATLEAVVSRMKSIGSDVRFVALSATVPNSDDIATWLGKDPVQTHIPAVRERFGEEFRPVKLQRHIVGYSGAGNDFAFDKTLDSKLPEVITKYSHRKPLMVFCFSRASCSNTAQALANWWATRGPKDRYWSAPRRQILVADKTLRNCIASGVSYHHAGLTLDDRNTVEKGFLEGEINVICCTSTLAVGVNLPCHMVIIKGTMAYKGPTIRPEYSDLEVMQMLGRAGRPQFDNSAVAVIMTRSEKVKIYEKMLSGQEVMESCLHLNLIEHLNAEIGLGTVTDLYSAKKWLAGTFLYVRLKQNPEHYRLDGDPFGHDLDDRLERICHKDIDLLQELDLTTKDARLQATELGDAMARYYVKFDTMKAILHLPPKPKLLEILSALSQAAEFHEIRFRAGEKSFYRDLNKSPSVRFPIPVDLALPPHKVSLILQSVLGDVELPTDENSAKHRHQYDMEQTLIFQHVYRLIRCVIDCQLHLEDSIGARNALMLNRSLSARVWDDSPLQLKQIETVGAVGVRKFVNAGIKSIEDLEGVEAHRIETIMSRQPTYGMKLLSKKVQHPMQAVKVDIKAEIGFMNDVVPLVYGKKHVFICFLAETSDGHKIHFLRLSARKLGQGENVLFAAHLTCPTQSITAYVMCDEFAGTMREATIKPNVPPAFFPAEKRAEQSEPASRGGSDIHKPDMNTSRRRSNGSAATVGSKKTGIDEFDESLDDADLAGIVFSGGNLDFAHIDSFADGTGGITRRNTVSNAKAREVVQNQAVTVAELTQLSNGKWACNHKCKDKSACKHMCCRDGLDKPPKLPNKKAVPSGSKPTTQQIHAKIQTANKNPSPPQQTQLQFSTSKRTSGRLPSSPPFELDLTQRSLEPRKTYEGPDYGRIRKLHSNIVPRAPPKSITRISHTQPSRSIAQGETPTLSFLHGHDHGNSKENSMAEEDVMADYEWHSDGEPVHEKVSTTMSAPSADLELRSYEQPSEGSSFGEDDSMLEDAFVGLADSQQLEATQRTARSERNDVDVASDDTGVLLAAAPTLPYMADEDLMTQTPVVARKPKGQGLFLTDTSSSRDDHQSPEICRIVPTKRVREVEDFNQPPTIQHKRHRAGLNDCGADPTPNKDGVNENNTDLANAQQARQEEAEVPDAYKGLDAWLLEEFGGVVEFV